MLILHFTLQTITINSGGTFCALTGTNQMLDTRLKKYAGRRFANMSALVTSASRRRREGREGGGVAGWWQRHSCASLGINSWDLAPSWMRTFRCHHGQAKPQRMKLRSVSTFFFFLLSVTPKQFLASVWTQQENICQQICSDPRLNNIYTPMALIATGSQLLCQNRSQKEARIYNYIDGIITNQACTQFTV